MKDIFLHFLIIKQTLLLKYMKVKINTLKIMNLLMNLLLKIFQKKEKEKFVYLLLLELMKIRY